MKATSKAPSPCCLSGREGLLRHENLEGNVKLEKATRVEGGMPSDAMGVSCVVSTGTPLSEITVVDTTATV